MTREQLLKAIFAIIEATLRPESAGEFHKVVYKAAPELTNVTLAEVFTKLNIGDLLDIANALDES